MFRRKSKETVIADALSSSDPRYQDPVLFSDVSSDPSSRGSLPDMNKRLEKDEDILAEMATLFPGEEGSRSETNKSGGVSGCSSNNTIGHSGGVGSLDEKEDTASVKGRDGITVNDSDDYSPLDEEMEEHLNLNDDDLLKEYEALGEEHGFDLEEGDIYGQEDKEEKEKKGNDLKKILDIISTLEKRKEKHCERAKAYKRAKDRDNAIIEYREVKVIEAQLEQEQKRKEEVEESLKSLPSPSRKGSLQKQVSDILTREGSGNLNNNKTQKEEGEVQEEKTNNGLSSSLSTLISSSSSSLPTASITSQRRSSREEDTIQTSRKKQLQLLNNQIERKKTQLSAMKESGTIINSENRQALYRECKELIAKRRQIEHLLLKKDEEIASRKQKEFRSQSEANQKGSSLEEKSKLAMEKEKEKNIMKEQEDEIEENKGKGQGRDQGGNLVPEPSPRLVVDPAQTKAYEMIEKKTEEFKKRHLKNAMDLKRRGKEPREEFLKYRHYLAKLEELEQAKLRPEISINEGQGFFDPKSTSSVQKRQKKEKIMISYDIPLSKDQTTAQGQTDPEESIDGETTSFVHLNLIEFDRPKRDARQPSRNMKAFMNKSITFTAFKEESAGWLFSRPKFIKTVHGKMNLSPLLTKCEHSEKVLFLRENSISKNNPRFIGEDSYIEVTLRLKTPIESDEIVKVEREELVFDPYPPNPTLNEATTSKFNNLANNEQEGQTCPPSPSSSISFTSSTSSTTASNNNKIMTMDGQGIQTPAPSSARTREQPRPRPILTLPLPPEFEDVGKEALQDPLGLNLMFSFRVMEHELSLLSPLTAEGVRNPHYNLDGLGEALLQARQFALQMRMESFQNMAIEGKMTPEQYIESLKNSLKKDIKICKYLKQNGREEEYQRVFTRANYINEEIKEGEQQQQQEP